MDVHDEFIPAEEYAAFIDAMPEVCVELVIDRDGAALVLKRTNEPAQDEWFWPGGRLYKGETLEAAAHRIADEELGLAVDLAERLGVYAHFWETSPLPGAPSRHTVNVVFRATPAAPLETMTLDEQHSDWRLVESVEPDLHEYVRQYLRDAAFFDPADEGA